jgi:hypothetical protein
MEHLIYTNPYSISKELCNDIITKYEKEEKAKYEGVTHRGLNKSIKNTTDFIIPVDGDNEWHNIYKLLEVELTTNVILYSKQFNHINFNDDKNNIFHVIPADRLVVKSFMIQRYIKGVGKYVYHNDFSIDWDKKSYRVLTFLFYLNTLEEGGHTEFWGNYKIKPETGKLLLFPASWTFPHCGQTPISDNKYIITGWIYSMD